MNKKIVVLFLLLASAVMFLPPPAEASAGGTSSSISVLTLTGNTLQRRYRRYRRARRSIWRANGWNGNYKRRGKYTYYIYRGQVKRMRN